MAKKENKGINYYKYITFILLSVLLIVIIAYGLSVYKDNVFNQGVAYGQQTTIAGIINSVSTERYVTFTDGNASLTLVSSQELQMVRENTLLEIMSYVQKEGSVSLYNNETNMILVPYEAPEEN